MWRRVIGLTTAVALGCTYQILLTQHRFTLEDSRTQAWKQDPAIKLSGVLLEERYVDTTILRPFRHILPQHQSLLIPTPDGTLRHVGLRDVQRPVSGRWWPFQYSATQWSLHTGQGYQHIPMGRRIPIEAYAAFWEQHGRPPRVNVTRLNELTRTPEELETVGQDPESNLQGFFMQPRRDARGQWVFHNCRSAVYDVVHKAELP